MTDLFIPLVQPVRVEFRDSASLDDPILVAILVSGGLSRNQTHQSKGTKQ